MRNILNKIFTRKLGIGKFLISAIAFLLGFSLVLLSLHFYLKVTDFLAPESQSNDYIILSKEVALGNTIFGSKAEFSQEDIDDLKSQNFVEDLGVFEASRFDLKAHVGGNIGFTTELFFESVADQFIDDKPFDFRWIEGSDFLPIIISKDFLNQYNFGYALGRGTPQLSRSTIGMVPLIIEMNGPGGKKILKAKVVGFSERISSIVVPAEFLSWANKNIGKVENPSISRVIIKVNREQAGSIEKYFEDHNLKVSEDKFKYSKIFTIINVVMSIIMIIGVSFIIFSLVIVIMNFALIVADAKEEIRLLIQLGYKTKYIFSHLSFYFSIFIFTVSLLTAVIFFTVKNILTKLFIQNGIEITEAIGDKVIVCGVTFIFISLIVSLFSISKVIKNHS